MLRMRALAFAVLSLASLTVTGCGEDLGSTSVVDRLRTIAVRADRPEAPPGTNVHLEALVIDPMGPLRALDHAWFVCVTEPGETPQTCASANLSVMPTLCALQPEAKICLVGLDPAADYKLPELALAGRAAGEAGQVIVTHIVGPQGTLMACADQFAQDGTTTRECQVTIKRLAVSRSDQPNVNPIIKDLRFDGMPLVSQSVTAESKDHMISATLEDGAVQPLPVPKNGQDKELLFVAWYTSPAGDISEARTEPPKLENKYQAPRGQGPVRLIAVVHDDRGGVSWVDGQIRVQ